MNLQFLENINGKETNFKAKIWAGIYSDNRSGMSLDERPDFFISKIPEPNGFWTAFKPKIHTIRQDKKNRWSEGQLIHFKTWEGRPHHSKNIEIAPAMRVKSVQKIELKFYRKTNKLLMLLVDDKNLGLSEIHKLAINDGFEDIESMIAYLGRNFSGKIIHWTDFSYQ